MPKGFPDTLYITRETDTDGTAYFLAQESLSGIDREQVVATYQLKATDKLTIRRELSRSRRG